MPAKTEYKFERKNLIELDEESVLCRQMPKALKIVEYSFTNAVSFG